jgi:hypothetical protein
MEGLTLQVEIIPSLVEATWHVQAVSWNLHVDYKLAINSLVFFSKIPCFCHQLPPTASFPGLIIAITVHLWHLLCRIHRIKVARYTGMAKNHFAAACFSYFILTMYRYIMIYWYIYIMHTQIHTHIYIYCKWQQVSDGCELQVDENPVQQTHPSRSANCLFCRAQRSTPVL